MSAPPTASQRHYSAMLDAPTGQAALRQLFYLRCIGVLMVSLITLAASQIFMVALRLDRLAPGLVALAVYAAYTGVLVEERRPVSERTLFWHLVGDLQILSYLLYFSGGDENPFATLYFVPLALAAAYLRWAQAMLVTAIMLSDFLLIHLLQFKHLAMSDGGPVPIGLMAAGGDASYLLTGAFLALFVSRLATASRDRAAALAQAREQQRNDELVVGFGTLAAGTAHELANPLSSISVAAAECRDGRLPPEQALTVIISQAQACRQTLRNLAETGRRAREASGEVTALDDFLGSIAARFNLLRPDASLATDWAVPQPAPLVREDATLTQSLIALLNNAAEASPDAVALQASLREQTLVVEVADRGPGISPAQLERIGQPFQSTRRPGEGMGIGLFLAKTSVERLGGVLSFAGRQGGGTCVTMALPLAALEP